MDSKQAMMRKIADQEIWILGGLVLASVAFERLLPICIGAGITLWVIRWVGTQHLSLRTSADWCILCIVLALPVTLWISPLAEVTKLQVYRVLSGILLYYAIVNWATTGKRLQTITLGLIMIGSGLSAFALVSVEWAVTKWFSIFKVVLQAGKPILIDSVNPNVMAGSLILILPLAAGGMFANWGKSSRLFRMVSTISAVMIGGILVLTLSRGALLALALALAIFISMRWRWGWLIFIPAAAGIGVAYSQVGDSNFMEALLSGTSVGSLEGRAALWSRALLLARDFPFTGIGMGAVEVAIHRLAPLSLNEPGVLSHAHNLYIQVFLDLGLLGFTGWLATLMLVTYVAWKVYRAGMQDRRAGWITGMGAALFCSQIALVLHGLSDAVTWGMVRPAPLVWALWGLVMALANLTLRPKFVGNK
jgi:putative inorganic carbon (HCO3(-)) transporter